MKSTLKLIRRFLMIVILSIFLLLIMNLILLFVISGPNIGNKSPWTAADEVAAALVQQGDGTYAVSYTHLEGNPSRKKFRLDTRFYF